MPSEQLLEKTPFANLHFLCNFFHLQTSHGTITPPHWHEHIEFVRIEKGYTSAQIDGELFEMKEGEIMMVGRQQIHFLYNDKPIPTTVSCLVFNPNIILSPLAGDIEKHMIIPLISHRSHVNRILKNSTLSKTIYQKLEEISSLFQQSLPGFELYVKSILLQIFSELYYYSQPQLDELAKHNLNHHNIDRFDKLFLFLREHYQKPITTREAADISNMSNTHFCHVFKRQMGMSFKQYLMLIRVNIAEGLLRETEDSIGCIAEQVGFPDINYFSRTFKKIRGLPPSKIRSQSASNPEYIIPAPWKELL